MSLSNTEVVLALIAEGLLIVDTESGKIYSTKRGFKYELQGGTTTGGYIGHHFRYQGQSVGISRQRIVWIAANGPIETGLEVDHINNVRTDCRLSNLELTTRLGNAAVGHHKGEVNSMSKVTASQVAEIRSRWPNETLDKIALDYPISRGQVWRIATGENWNG